MEDLSQPGFLDPLSAAPAIEGEDTSTLSLDKPAEPELSLSTDNPTPGVSQQAPDEGAEDLDNERNDAADSSSTWSPEVLQPDVVPPFNLQV